MPATLTDVALKSSAAKPLVWIRLINNKSGASYTSLAASDGSGYYSITNVPPGDYALWEGLSAAAITTLVNPHYQVAPSQINLANPVDYGAKFDGSDDSAAWQLAINDVRDGFYGGVWHPGGTSYVQGLTWYTGVHLFGQGYGRSILMLFPGSTQSLIRSLDFLTLASQNGGTGPGTSDLGIYNFGFHNVSFDGNKANCPLASDLWQIYGYGYVVENVRVRNAARDNVYSEWGPGAAAPVLGDSMESHWVNFKSHDSGRHEINFNGPHDSQFLNTIAYKPGGANVGRGIWVQAKGGSQWTNCHSWGIGMTETWRLESTNVLTNCEGEGGSVSMCTILANDNQIMGGLWFGGSGGAYTFIIGAIGVPVGGTVIDTKALNAPVACVNIVNEVTFSRFRIQYYGATPVFAGNAPISTDVIEISAVGGAAQVTGQLPANLQIGKFATGAEGNYFDIQGKATGTPPQIVANGVSDANIGVKILAKGSGSFFLGSGDGTRNSWQLNTAAAGNAPVLVVIGPDANIALSVIAKGTGAIVFSNSGENFIQYFGAVGGGSPTVYASGPNDANIALSLQGKGGSGIALGSNALNFVHVRGSATGVQVSVSAEGGDGNITLALIAKGANGVSLAAQFANFISVIGAAAAGTPTINAVGSDATVAMKFVTKALGSYFFGATQANSNTWQMDPAASGAAPQLTVIGTDANIDLRFTPKGTGQIDLNKATVALGGGAAPTFGTIGGTGPAAAAQNSWLACKVAGTLSFIPIWR